MSKIIYKGQEYISGSQYQELTQTEYNALSEAEKKNGTLYFVTDGVPGGGQDYVVDQGTYYSWKYRKWASGTAECWGIGSSTSTHYATLFGGYAYTAQFDLPPIFNATPIVTYSCNGGGAFNVTGTQTSSTTSTRVAVYSVSNTSGEKTLSWRMYVIGTWK